MKLPSSQTLNFVLMPLCALLLFLVLHRGCTKCPQQITETVKTMHDTTYLMHQFAEINVPAPVPKYILPALDSDSLISSNKAITSFGQVQDTGYNAYTQGYSDATNALVKMRHTCRDTAYYNDTITSKDNWRLILIESLTGNRIICRKPFVEDLRPVITTTVISQSPKPKEHIRFYGGADLVINTNYFNRWGADIAGILTLPQGYALRYAYDLHNNAHTLGFYALIKLKK